MKFETKTLMNLHLFDGAGAGTGAGASTGTGAGDGTAGQGSVNGTADKAAMGENNQQDATATGQEPTPEDRKARYNEYINGEGKEFFDKDVQKIINKRFKEFKTLESNAKTLEPMLQALSQMYDVDSSDIKNLVDAVLNDNKFYEDKARANGVPVDFQKQFDTMQRQLKVNQQEEVERQRAEESKRIVEDWKRQAEELKHDIPDFDLDDAITNNRDFADLLSRQIPVKVAYIACFPDGYHKAVEKGIMDTIKSKGNRVVENGATQASSTTSSFNVSNLTPAQRRDLANRASRGEKITLR